MNAFVRHLSLAFLCVSIAPACGQSQDADAPSIYARRNVVSTPPPHNFPAFNAGESKSQGSDAESKESSSPFAIPAVTVTSSLAVVLGLFAAMVWLTRKYGSRSIAPGAIPREVMESLGSTAIDARTRVTMLRCGSRIIVVAQTATEIRPLSEITDPEEVRHLTAACLGDSKRNFASTLQEIEREKAKAGFTGPTMSQDDVTPRPRGRLFASA